MPITCNQGTAADDNTEQAQARWLLTTDYPLCS
jgi:hypothetical protein